MLCYVAGPLASSLSSPGGSGVCGGVDGGQGGGRPPIKSSSYYGISGPAHFPRLPTNAAAAAAADQWQGQGHWQGQGQGQGQGRQAGGSPEPLMAALQHGKSSPVRGARRGTLKAGGRLAPLTVTQQQQQQQQLAAAEAEAFATALTWTMHQREQREHGGSPTHLDHAKPFSSPLFEEASARSVKAGAGVGVGARGDGVKGRGGFRGSSYSGTAALPSAYTLCAHVTDPPSPPGPSAGSSGGGTVGSGLPDIYGGAAVHHGTTVQHGPSNAPPTQHYLPQPNSHGGSPGGGRFSPAAAAGGGGGSGLGSGGSSTSLGGGGGGSDSGGYAPQPPSLPMMMVGGAGGGRMPRNAGGGGGGGHLATHSIQGRGGGGGRGQGGGEPVLRAFGSAWGGGSDSLSPALAVP